MSLFRTIVRAFVGDPGEPETLDHMPVVGAPDWRAAKMQEARRRFGKPFAPEVKVARVTEPSHLLAHIQDQAEAARKVTNIETRRRK